MSDAPVICTSFCFPLVTFDVVDTNSTTIMSSAHTIMRELCERASTTFGCDVSFSGPDLVASSQHGRHEFLYSLSLIGALPLVNSARSFLLVNNPSKVMVTVKANRAGILNKNGEMKSRVKAKMDEIIRSTGAQITCLGSSADDQSIQSLPQLESMDIEIVGNNDSVASARVKLLLLLDNMAGLNAESLNVEAELQPALSGRKSVIAESLMHETVTNIYFPPRLLESRQDPAEDVHITGSLHTVVEAKDRLKVLAAAKRRALARFNVQCLPRKIDWMVLNRGDSLAKIMTDNGVHLVIPPPGSNSNNITVVGDDKIYIERAVRALMLLASQFYISSIQIGDGVSPSIDVQTCGLLRSIAQTSRAEIIYYGDFIELYGLETSVKMAFQQITEHAAFQFAIREVKFQIELALEHKEFINGKKSGKINKIIKSTGCRIQFHENYNDFNMVIEVAHALPARAIESMVMLEDELPAEISFFIPETFHKRIIGVGGKNIQRIMKKYGVYVKFSNAEEYAQLGGYFENIDNVIARTPAKNTESLDLLKQSIFELINMKEKPEMTLNVSIPRQLHRFVLGARGLNIKEIEKLYRVTITFPNRDLGSDEITIAGQEQQVVQARIQLHQFIPETHEFYIPASHIAIQLLQSPDFCDGFVHKLHQELGIDVFVQLPSIDDYLGQDCVFMLHYFRGNTNIERAKTSVIEFLKSKQVPMQSQPVPRSGSYANLAPQKSYDTFQHFNSKLLSPVTTAPESPLQLLSPSYSLFETMSSPFDLPPRSAKTPGAHSVPNLRQVFDYSRASASLHSPGDVIPRSQSDAPQDISPTNLLSSTLSAMAISAGEPWSAGEEFSPRTIFSHTSYTDGQRQFPVSSQDANDSSNIDATFTASRNASSRGTPIGSGSRSSSAGELQPQGDKYRILPPSRSAPSSGDEKGQSRFGKERKKQLSSLVIESHFDSEESPPFNEEQMVRVLRMDDPHRGLELLLDSLDLSTYFPTFVEQEVDLNMLLSLGDSDLKELGVKTFGARKKLASAIRDCNQMRIKLGAEADTISIPPLGNLLPNSRPPPGLSLRTAPLQPPTADRQFYSPQMASAGPYFHVQRNGMLPPPTTPSAFTHFQMNVVSPSPTTNPELSSSGPEKTDTL